MVDVGRRQNIWNFYLPIEMPGIWFFQHAQTLKRIDLYLNGKFEKGEYDTQGFKKYFYNIVRPACDVASKFISLQTKDIILIPEHSDDEERLWLMQQDLREWLKENKFNRVMDDVRDAFPRYGSVVLKKSLDKNWHNVNIHNLRFDVSVDALENSPFLYELQLKTIREMRSMKDWDQQAVDELISRGEQTKYIVYECYDYDREAKKKWKRSFRADLFTYVGVNNTLLRTVEARINRISDYVPSIVLYEDEVDELPYREVHFERIPGRWLGLGYVEYLFDNQIARNELKNIKHKKVYLNGLNIYQTKDQTVGNNIMTEMENGDILKVMSEVTPVDNTERNLAYFDSEVKDWDQNKIEKTFTTDLSRGENLPSRTPLGVANMQIGMVTSFFDEKRKQLGIFYRDLIVEDIIPRFGKEIAPEHSLMFSGSEPQMEKLATSIAMAEVGQDALKYAEKHGFFPAVQEFQREVDRKKAKLLTAKGLNMNIPESYYKDARYKTDVLTTGEQIDTTAKRETLQLVMQMWGTNPAVFQDPAMRAMLFMIMELSGIDPVELDMVRSAFNQANQQQNQQVQPGQPGQPGQPMGQQLPQGQLPRGGSIVVPAGIANKSLMPKRQVL